MNNPIVSPRALIAVLAISLLTVGCENIIHPTPEATSPTTLPDARQVREEPKDHGAPDCCSPGQPAEKATSEKNEEAQEPATSSAKRVETEEEKEIPPEKDPPIPDEYKPLNKQKTIFFEKTKDGKRRVHVLAEVCQRDVMLEVFLCKNDTKEHESVLRADIDARDVHMGLIAAGAKAGSTVKFVPNYQPATGDVIKVSVTYHKDGKLLTKPAQSWVLNVNTKKEMEPNWVFAGSRFFKFPDEPKKTPFYCANNGEVIAIANFSDSMLDLPVKSSKEDAELGFKAYAERIPPLKTKVLVTLEPVPAEKK